MIQEARWRNWTQLKRGLPASCQFSEQAPMEPARLRRDQPGVPLYVKPRTLSVGPRSKLHQPLFESHDLLQQLLTLDGRSRQ